MLHHLFYSMRHSCILGTFIFVKSVLHLQLVLNTTARPVCLGHFILFVKLSYLAVHRSLTSR